MLASVAAIVAVLVVPMPERLGGFRIGLAAGAGVAAFVIVKMLNPAWWFRRLFAAQIGVGTLVAGLSTFSAKGKIAGVEWEFKTDGLGTGGWIVYSVVVVVTGLLAWDERRRPPA